MPVHDFVPVVPRSNLKAFIGGTLFAALLCGAIVGVTPAWAQELFVPNFGTNSVTVYNRTDSGNTAPLRTLSGGATGLNQPRAVAVDVTNNELFVSNIAGNSVTVYARTASGDTAPLRTLSGAATLLDNPVGIALDLVNNELLVANRSLVDAPTNASVTVYSRTADGNIAPLRTITGPATGLNLSHVLALDLVNNEILVSNAADFATPPGTPSVTVYSRTANGNIAPLRTLSGASTGLAGPLGVGLDLVNNELAISNVGGNSITVYNRTDSGNTAPQRTIAGGTTGMNAPLSSLVDPINNEIVVANQNGDSVTVYSRTANGDVGPLRTLTGGATGLSGPGVPAVAGSPAPTSTPTDTPTSTPTQTPASTPTSTPTAAVVVPTLSPGMLLVFALSLAGVAFAIMRRSLL